MKKLLYTIPFAFLACTTNNSTSNGEQIDLSELGNHTLISQEVVDGETRGIQMLVEHNVLEWNFDEGYVITQNPGNQCDFVEYDDTWQGDYVWVSNFVDTLEFEHNQNSLTWNDDEYSGGPELFSKWSNQNVRMSSTLNLSENKITEEVNYTVECWADNRAVGSSSEQLSCSTIEVKTLPQKLTVKRYQDVQMGRNEVWKYADKSCHRYSPSPITKASCDFLQETNSSEEDPCEEIINELKTITGKSGVSICKADYMNDDYCDEDCINFDDPDCD